MAASKRLSVVDDIPSTLLKKYLAQDVIAVDTEMDGLRLGRDHVRLVQVCDQSQNVCLVGVKPPAAPANLKKLLIDKGTVKIFHFAITDVSMLQLSLGIKVAPYHCTKVMSKVVRTYTEGHGLRNLAAELLNIDMVKESQQTNWAAANLSSKQLQYAANDVLHLVKIYRKLQKMLEARGKLPSGISAEDLNKRAQQCLPTVVELLINGYGDRDMGWESSVFAH